MGTSMLITGSIFHAFAKVLRWTESVSMSRADQRKGVTSYSLNQIALSRLR